MGTSTVKTKQPVSKHGFAHDMKLPPPYQFAIEDAAFQMKILDDRGARDYDCECALLPPVWFSVTLTVPTRKRFLYLVQQETATGLVVLLMLYERDTGADAERHDLRLPPSGAWLRAVVDGTVHVLTSDLVLSRKAITAWIGGHEPPTTPAQPPYT
jgi:hypothetical protein